jgi:alkylation response protein AidB-like acyl-CoA dehydrogenase
MPIERARELRPLIEAAADEAERERRLPERVAVAMAERGLHRLAWPEALGGLEADPPTQIATIEAISAADGSTGWNLMIGMETAGLVLLGMKHPQGVLHDPLTILCGSTAAMGRAEEVDGGLRVSGRWPFVSGCHNAHWFSGLCQLHRDGELVVGAPPVWGLVPRGAFEILDTWNVSGMCGSGSHDVVVEDVFVAESHTAGFGLASGEEPWRQGPLFRIPMGARLAYNKTGVSLGIARGALDAFGEFATTKRPRDSRGTLRDEPQAQIALASAEAELRSARAFVMESVGALWERVVAGDEVTLQQRAILQLACSNASQACIRAVDRVHAAAGTSANIRGAPFERRMRDVQVVRQHITVSPQLLQDVGRVLLGLDPKSLMLTLPG